MLIPLPQRDGRLGSSSKTTDLDGGPDPRQTPARLQWSAEGNQSGAQPATPADSGPPAAFECIFFLFFKTMPPDAPFSARAAVFVSLPFFFVCLSVESPCLATALRPSLRVPQAGERFQALIVSIQLAVITSGGMITEFIRLPGNNGGGRLSFH